MRSQRALAREASKDSKGVNALGDTAGDRQITFVQAKHLQALDQARIASRTSGSDCIVRSSDAQIERQFSRRVVGNGARVVMMRPDFNVVVEAANLMDFRFGFHVPMFGHANVYADP